MARADPQIVSFASGEISSGARGRVDVERYAAACTSLRNMIVTPQGEAVHRGGTLYAGATQTSAGATQKAVLLPFVANTGAEFVIEITGGTNGMRFWFGGSRALVYDSAGTWNISFAGSIATLTPPWAAADLFDADGTPRVTFMQSNDVMWLMHPNYLPWKLSRIATYKFSGAFMGDGVNAAVPFKDIDPNNTVTMQASAATGAGVTLTAGAATFAPSDVGSWFCLERPKADATLPWETGKAITSGNVRSSSGRYYGATNSASTATVKPTHSFGTRSDGGVTWEWYDDGYGVAAITGYTDSTHVTVTVVRRLPDTVVSGTTTRWAKQAWNATDGYPVCGAIYCERTMWVRGQTVWGSVAGDYENFQAQDGGLQTPDMAVTLTFGAQRNDRAKWCAAAGSVLLVGTASSEFAIGPQSGADPFGPGNTRADSIGGNGCNGTQPVLAGKSLMFVERGGRRVREARYSLEADSLDSRDLTIFADHIFRRGTACGLAHQRLPFGVLWATTTTGQLKGFTYQSEQRVWAWHQHVLGGAGFGAGLTPAVRSVASIASPDGQNDDLWLCVERRVNNQTVYYVEVIGPHLSYTALGYVSIDDLTNVRDSAFLDCQIQKVVNVDATTIPGLSHLAGATVAATVDGKYVTPRVVTANQITVSGVDQDCRAWVGLPRDADVRPVPLIGQSASGTAQAKRGRISHVTVRVRDSVNFIAGKPGGTLERWLTREVGDELSEPTQLASGDFTVGYGDGTTEPYERPEVLVRQDQPFPLIVQGIFARLSTED